MDSATTAIEDDDDRGWHVSTPLDWTANFRRVRHTTKYGQEVEMTLAPNEVIAGEVHPTNDQLFFVASGSGVALVRGPREATASQRYLTPGTRIYVDAGTWHEIRAGAVGLAVVSIYMPWHHPPGTVHFTNPETRKPSLTVSSDEGESFY